MNTFRFGHFLVAIAFACLCACAEKSEDDSGTGKRADIIDGQE